MEIARHSPLKGHKLEAAKQHKIDVDTKSILEVRMAIGRCRGVANRAKYYNATEIQKAKHGEGTFLVRGARPSEFHWRAAQTAQQRLRRQPSRTETRVQDSLRHCQEFGACEIGKSHKTKRNCHASTRGVQVPKNSHSGNSQVPPLLLPAPKCIALSHSLTHSYSV